MKVTSDSALGRAVMKLAASRAFARVARPFIQESISEAPPTFDTLIRTAPRIRSFLGHSASLFAELRPGIKALSESSPVVASAFETGADVLPDAPRLNAQLAPTLPLSDDIVREPLSSKPSPR